ncbi:hypothetical protein QBC43DRAFT_216374 [Cladorrhinum sp. PSN259]|nr:hypothetical protein QBC43DRAFT_216374 [Cladorrhinum sp. PSN259]
MGVAMSTLFSWGFVLGVIALYYSYSSKRDKLRPSVRPAVQRQRLEEKQPKKETKEKAKRQRVEAHKDTESIKPTQPKERAPKSSSSNKQAKAPVAEDSSDDGIDNREFARQLASIKQGTNLNAPKKADEKRQKSVKQSRAQIIDDATNETKATKPSAPAPVSAPSSAAGVDADDDESSSASPELKATDAGDVSDMLEPKSSGPSVLRLTDTDKVKPKKEKNAKEPEKTETKKQRQNRKKKEQEQEQRREDEKHRKAAEEAQRRVARIAEGRAAKDGSAFMTAQTQKPSVWTGNEAHGSGNASTATTTNGDSAPVTLLDTFDNDGYVKVPLPKGKPAPKDKDAASANWIATLPSEEEQMEMLRDEEAWNTVKTKKSKKKGTNAANESSNESEPSAAPSKPASNLQPTNGPSVSGKPGKSYAQGSSFAALTTTDEPEVEENEWDV